MTNDASPVPARRPVRRWLGIGGLVLGYGSLFVVTSVVDKGAKTVRASRAELGSIELRYGKGPGGVPGWVAHFNLDVSVAKAWKVLRECESLPQVLEGVSACKLLETGPGWKIHRMDLTHPEKAYMKTRTVYDETNHRTQWKMVEGSFQAAEGGIALKAHSRVPGWTRVSYAYHLSISPLLPQSFEIPRIRRSVRRMAREIQQYFSKQPPRGKPSRAKSSPSGHGARKVGRE